MGNKSKDASLFALQERVEGRSYGRQWRTLQVGQRSQLPAPSRNQRVKCIRDRWGKWL